MDSQTRLRIDQAVASSFVQPIRRTFRKEQKAVLEAVSSADTISDAHAGIDEAVTVSRWIPVLVSLWLSKPIVDLYLQTVTELDGEPQTQMHPAVQRMFTRYATQHAREIVDTTRERLKRVVDDGMKTRQFRSSLRKLMRETYTDMVAGRADHMAFVEGLQATESARYEAARSVTPRTTRQRRVKVWFTQGDSRVRPTHQAMNNQSRLVTTSTGGEGIFTVGGSRMRYPRDPSGAAKETIGCRCWLEYRILPPTTPT